MGSLSGPLQFGRPLQSTKSEFFDGALTGPLLPPFFPHFSPLFPLRALFTLPPLLPSSPPLSPPFLTPGKLRFRHSSDLAVEDAVENPGLYRVLVSRLF